MLGGCGGARATRRVWGRAEGISSLVLRVGVDTLTMEGGKEGVLCCLIVMRQSVCVCVCGYGLGAASSAEKTAPRPATPTSSGSDETAAATTEAGHKEHRPSLPLIRSCTHLPSLQSLLKCVRRAPLSALKHSKTGVRFSTR
jgi:hypothetical protein